MDMINAQIVENKHTGNRPLQSLDTTAAKSCLAKCIAFLGLGKYHLFFQHSKASNR